MKRNGFTLVELLIVVVIIAVLSAIGVTVYGSAQKSARDARRKADIAAIHNALEVFYNSRGLYTQPEAMCNDTSYGGLGSCGAAGGNGDWDVNSDLRDLITGGFMRELPKDPLNTPPYYYNYEPTNQDQPSPGDRLGDHYSLCANQLETTGQPYCLNSQN